MSNSILSLMGYLTWVLVRAKASTVSQWSIK